MDPSPQQMPEGPHVQSPSGRGLVLALIAVGILLELWAIVEALDGTLALGPLIAGVAAGGVAVFVAMRGRWFATNPAAVLLAVSVPDGLAVVALVLWAIGGGT